jgi:hypothetical protein
MAGDSITTDRVCDQGNVFHFPREIIAEQEVRFCRRRVEKLTADIEAADPDTRDGMLTIALGELMLPRCIEDLEKAEAALLVLRADDALRVGDKVYRAECSPAGPN